MIPEGVKVQEKRVRYIVITELLRSIAVYFFASVGLSALLVKGSINVGLATYFLLAFAVTVVHFSIMVWYRKRKEHAVPSKTSLSATSMNEVQVRKSYLFKTKKKSK